jgi:hypothetical protein
MVRPNNMAMGAIGSATGRGYLLHGRQEIEKEEVSEEQI